MTGERTGLQLRYQPMGACWKVEMWPSYDIVLQHFFQLNKIRNPGGKKITDCQVCHSVTIAGKTWKGELSDRTVPTRGGVCVECGILRIPNSILAWEEKGRGEMERISTSKMDV